MWHQLCVRWLSSTWLCLDSRALRGICDRRGGVDTKDITMEKCRMLEVGMLHWVWWRRGYIYTQTLEQISSIENNTRARNVLIYDRHDPWRTGGKQKVALSRARQSCPLCALYKRLMAINRSSLARLLWPRLSSDSTSTRTTGLFIYTTLTSML